MDRIKKAVWATNPGGDSRCLSWAKPGRPDPRTGHNVDQRV